jgi:hypothetical protein
MRHVVAITAVSSSIQKDEENDLLNLLGLLA